MISNSSTLPTIIIFESHWDSVAKQVVQGLLPKLKKQGYSTICYEASENRTEDDIVQSIQDYLNEDQHIFQAIAQSLSRHGLNASIDELSGWTFERLSSHLRLYVSTQKYRFLAERILQHQAAVLTAEILKTASSLSMSVTGIDAPSVNTIISSENMSQRVEAIDQSESERIGAFAKNILALQRKREGIIFVCGASHAENLMRALKHHSSMDSFRIYYPFTPKNFFDDSGSYHIIENDTLRDHTYPLGSQEAILNLQNRIEEEVLKSSETVYKEEAPLSSHVEKLNKWFSVSFKIYFKPNYIADAALEIDESIDISAMLMHMKSISLPFVEKTISGKKMIIIPNVNTSEVIEKIKRLT